MKEVTLAEKYVELCIRYNQELDWSPEECNDYGSWEELVDDLFQEWKEQER